ncbi:hypothetical protein VUR80DRAFT_1410 [Thermomyces stellatus]
MLRLRRPALPRSKPSLLRAAAGEPCLCNLIVPTQSPRYSRRAAIPALAPRRWFRQSTSSRVADWERRYGGEGADDADQREVQASFEQAHSLWDASSESAAYPDEPVPGRNSLETALRMIGDSSAKQDRSDKQSGRRGRKRRRAPSFAHVEETEASKEAEASKEKQASGEGKGSSKKKGSKKSASEKSEKGAGAKTTSRKSSKSEQWEVHTVDSESLELKPVPHSPDTVPGLSYELDRCLFKPGVYPMQDSRSRVYNFDPYLATIMPLNEFDYSALKGFVSSSNDPTLIAHALSNGKKYSGSTSSLSSMLSHLHFLLSAWRPINASHTTKGFELDSTNFTAITRAPAATFLRWRNGIYAVDADKEFDTANILSMLGRSLEKLLTLPKEEYELYRRSKSHQLTDKQRNSDNSYHYTMLGDFIMRSQLDAHDPRLPGEGMFDIKTRAVLSVRMDARGYEKGKDYQIRSKFGQFESFEREYFDMIRSAFLKYSLQVRMGRMDGIFVAYHNTERMFGFQYFPLEELDHALHGTTTTYLGDQEFKLSLHLLNQLLDRATRRFPKQALRLHIETRPTNPPLLYFFAKPVTEEKIERAQSVPMAEVERLERELMGYASREREPEQEKEEEGISEEPEQDAKDEAASSLSVAEMNQKAEEAVESDELGKEHVRRSIEEALKQSGLVEGKTTDEVQVDVETLLEMLKNGAYTLGEEASGIALEERGEMDASGSEVEQQGPAKSADQLAKEIDWASATSTAEQPGDIEASIESGTAERSLDDAIMNLIKQREDKDVSGGAASSDGSSRVAKFKQVLSELLAESRREQDGAEKKAEPSSSEEATRNSSGRESEPAGANPEAAFDDLEDDGGPLLGMILTIRNKVNGEYVARPYNLTPNKKWTVEYSIQTMNKERARKLYKQVKNRRRAALEDDDILRDQTWHRMFGSVLPRLSEKGREFRRREDERARGQPVWVVGEKKQKDWYEVFGNK